MFCFIQIKIGISKKVPYICTKIWTMTAINIPKIPIIGARYAQLIQLCEHYRVEKLYVFGSVITERFNPLTSDIDLIVELQPMSPIERGTTLLKMWDDLESLLERKVDLLTDQPIKNIYLKQSIERTKKLIYDRKSKEISGGHLERNRID
jgi:uncharacterized protein